MTDNTSPSANPYSAPHADLSAQEIGGTAELAGRGSRFLAILVDGLIMSLLAGVPLVWLMGGWTAYVTKAVSGGYVLKLGFIVIGIVVYLVVNGTFLARDGQSIGKKLLGIKIVGTDGGKVSFNRILSRRLGPTYLVQLIPTIGGLLCLIDVLFIFRESRQCLHDQIADTKVVKV